MLWDGRLGQRILHFGIHPKWIFLTASNFDLIALPEEIVRYLEFFDNTSKGDFHVPRKGDKDNIVNFSLEKSDRRVLPL